MEDVPVAQEPVCVHPPEAMTTRNGAPWCRRCRSEVHVGKVAVQHG